MRIRLVLPLLFALSLHAQTLPTTIANDDSCDIGVFPAATLLLPYFEVDVSSSGGDGQTTILSITNTAALPQVAQLTLWTDYGFPVISFPVYLTGYDMQVINLFDVVARGRLAPNEGTGPDSSPVGEFSRDEDGKPLINRTLDSETCANIPVQLPKAFIDRMMSAFTIGRIPSIGSEPACNSVGGVHANAIGYATIDVVGSCRSTPVTHPSYFRSEIRYDNVLTGDYQQIDAGNEFAQGGPLVHIRAISEGSVTGDQSPSFPRTFYSHLQPANRRTADRRQPLPSSFAARWIEGSGAGFETFFKIWRGVETGAGASCGDYVRGALKLPRDILRFDEEENVEVLTAPVGGNPPLPFEPRLPATSLVNVGDETLIPANPRGAVAGWLYFNLHDDERASGAATQAWVIASMRSESRFSVDMDAISLHNGCTPATAKTSGGQP